MANVSKLKDARRWSVDMCGVSALKRKYVVVCDEVTGENGEQKEFPGVPAIGSVHPVYKNLQVESYDVEEGEGVAKRTLTVTVNYAVFAGETGGSGQDATAQVEKWGWDFGTDEREMVDAVDGKAVLNSAGDVFDRVPTISVPAPTFTKVVKFRTRQNGMDNNCKVNQGSVTIGGRSYPEGSLLCLVSEERIIGDLVWAFRYTVQLKFRSNPVKLEGGSTATDIGWDVAITDAGMRELSADGKLKLIKAVDSETGRKCTVTSPELLDGNGHAVSRSGGVPKPYNIRFKAYERASFPNWFYSEPPMA
ncbi:MAG: hypothetical protein IKC80_10065 [Kiritimatiellae bacterium]|nr:hypothetical protein [Kiritimatiellia bacterium]